MAKVENKHKVLYFLTAGFPYGCNETFIETEIIYLTRYFEKVVIFSHDKTSSQMRNMPDNVEVIRIKYELNLLGKISSVFNVFSKIFWKEIYILKYQYSKYISFGIIKTLLISIQNSKRLASIYLKIYNLKNDVNPIFYSYWTNDCAIALAKLKCNEKFEFLVVSKMHRWDVYFEESKYNYLPLRKFIFNNVDVVYSISKDGINYMKNQLGITDNLKLSRLGINYQTDFKTIDHDIFLIVSCSNIISIKRVQLIAESLSKLKIKNINWVHFGDGPLKNEVLNYANKYLVNNVNFEFKGRVSNNAISSFYTKNNPTLFINLSSSEGIPVSIMEAMSFGIPVIATNVGGTSEIVNNENGFLLDSDPSQLEVTSKIQEFYNLAVEEKTKKRKAAFDTWNEKYNAEKNYNHFVEDILSL